MAIDWKYFTLRPYIKTLPLEEQLRLFNIANEKSINHRKQLIESFTDVSTSTLYSSRTSGDDPTESPTPTPSYNNQYSFLFDPGPYPYPDPAVLPRFTTPKNAALSPANNFTLSVWAKPFIVEPPDDGTIIDNANSSNGFILMHDDFGSTINPPEGRWNFELRKSGQTPIRARTNVAPLDNTWQHVVGVFLDGTGSIYLNGELKGSGSFANSTEIGYGNVVPTVGTSQGSTVNTIDPYSGSLQNMSLWNTAFTQDEINELYNGGTPTDLNEHSQVANGIAWWQFGGNGASGSFDGANWTELNCFDNSQYAMTSTNMVEADRVEDVPPS
jgi:hypothetical protein